jgi:hypothetical protein
MPADAIAATNDHAGDQLPTFDVVNPHTAPRQTVDLMPPPAQVNPPTAPLPSALLAGPATMAVAGWITWRIRRRGGRI